MKRVKDGYMMDGKYTAITHQCVRLMLHFNNPDSILCVPYVGLNKQFNLTSIHGTNNLPVIFVPDPVEICAIIVACQLVNSNWEDIVLSNPPFTQKELMQTIVNWYRYLHGTLDNLEYDLDEEGMIKDEG